MSILHKVFAHFELRSLSVVLSCWLVLLVVVGGCWSCYRVGWRSFWGVRGGTPGGLKRPDGRGRGDVGAMMGYVGYDGGYVGAMMGYVGYDGGYVGAMMGHVGLCWSYDGLCWPPWLHFLGQFCQNGDFT